jgi:hypothetical protein
MIFALAALHHPHAEEDEPDHRGEREYRAQDDSGCALDGYRS